MAILHVGTRPSAVTNSTAIGVRSASIGETMLAYGDRIAEKVRELEERE